MPRKQIDPLKCATCGEDSRLTDGREIFPSDAYLADRHFYLCECCGGYVGCHKGTKRPLGMPAGSALRAARAKLRDDMVDPLWKTAGMAEWSAARTRLYAFLAANLGLDLASVHVGMFDLETCRRAWSILRDVSYQQIRDWYEAHREEN